MTWRVVEECEGVFSAVSNTERVGPYPTRSEAQDRVDAENAPDLSRLTDDGDTVELNDGRTLRLRIESDDIDPFGEFEVYGKVASPGRQNEYGYQTRPKGFDGNAERLYYGNSGPIWWQPSPDGPKRGTPEFAGERDMVRNLLEFGMSGYLLEILDGEDAYGRPIVGHVASLWGIEPFPAREYQTEIVKELWSELESELESESIEPLFPRGRIEEDR
jgi:hypothetical protein